MSEEKKNEKKKEEIDFERLAASKKTSKGGRTTTVILLLICIVLTAAILYRMFSSFEGLAAGSRARSTEIAAVNVSVTPVERGTFSNITRVNGEVVTHGHEISILPDITSTGTITSVLCQKGDYVNEGDVLAYVDASRPGLNYKSSPIVAKVSGTILDMAVSVGSAVTSSTVIATIIPTEELLIETSVSEKFLGTIAVGMQATFETVAYPGRKYTAEVTYISPKLSTSSRTADVELRIEGETTGLKEGMYVKIDLETEHLEDVLIVPQSGLYTYLNNDVVFLAKGDTSERTVVELGSSSSDWAVVLSGVEEGDLVITAGTVSNGTLINVVEGVD